MNCKSCFAPVDGRSVVSCSECNAPLHKECAIHVDSAPLCDVCLTIAEEKPKNKFGEYALPEFIRRTHIETYKACPYKFYQEVLKNHPMPPNSYTQIGSDLHELFEMSCHGECKKERALAEMEGKFALYSDDLFQSGFATDNRVALWKRTTDSIDTFYDVVLPTIKNVFAVEETIFTNIGDNIPNVRITMDLITDVDGELHMHDWKTGRVMVGQKLSSDLQAPLYIYSVQQKYRRNVKSFTFYYLQENKTRVFTRSDIDPTVYLCTVGKREYKINLIDTIREIKSLFSRIKKGDFNPRNDNKNKYFTQKMCHLKELGLCCQDSDPWNNV